MQHVDTTFFQPLDVKEQLSLSRRASERLPPTGKKKRTEVRPSTPLCNVDAFSSIREAEPQFPEDSARSLPVNNMADGSLTPSGRISLAGAVSSPAHVAPPAGARPGLPHACATGAGREVGWPRLPCAAAAAGAAPLALASRVPALAALTARARAKEREARGGVPAVPVVPLARGGRCGARQRAKEGGPR